MKFQSVFLLSVFGLVSFASAFPRDARDDYNTEIDLHDFQKTYENELIRPDEMEAQVVMSMLPTKITHNYLRLSKQQTLAAFKLLKSILKPIIKSKEFRYSVKSLEQLMFALRDDPEVKRNLKEAVDAVQSMFQRTDSEVIKQLITWVLSQYVDLNTARSVSSMWSDMSPAITQWVVEPVLNYYKAWLTPAISSLSNGMNELFGEDISANVVGRSSRWSDYVDAYITRVAEMTQGARGMLEATAQFLEMQDSSKDEALAAI